MAEQGAGPAVHGERCRNTLDEHPATVDFVIGASHALAADHLAALAAVAAGAASGLVQLRDGSVLRLYGAFRLPAGWSELRVVPLRSTLAGLLFDTGAALVISDLHRDPRAAADAPMRRLGVGSYAGFPIRDGSSRVVGICGVLDDLPRTWTAAQLAAIEHAAQACGAFVAEQEARDVADRDRRFLDAVLESLRSPVAACDETGQVVLLNGAMRRVAPNPAGHFQAPDTSAAHGRFPPAGRPLSVDELPLSRALRGERIRQSEVLLRAPGRPPRLMLYDGQPILDAHGRRLGGVVAFTDVTERRRAERFRDGELRVVTALANSSRVEDAAARVVDAVGSTLGWAQAELWLADPAGVLRPAARWTVPGRDPAPSVAEEGDAGLTGRVFEEGRPLWETDAANPGSLVAGDGTRAPDLRTALAVPVPGGQRALGAVTVFSTVLEEPDQALIGVLSGMAAHVGRYIEHRRAEELELQLAQSKDEYLALVGHELRTPLTSIGSYAELLLSSDAASFAADGPELVRVIDRNASVLRDIVDDLLDLAALDSGHAIVRTDPVDLAELVRAAAKETAPAAVEARLTLSVDVPVAVSVIGDAGRLRQVVDNLLGNAIKYTPAGGRVDLALTELGGYAAELTVRDTGIGIPQEDRERLFDRFFRSANARERSIPGAGLSLAISRAILRRHGGTIALVPDPEPGTRIAVRLPLAPPT